ncbi:MAG: radical SAM protein, partial [Nitrospirae bacterium]|nr:radical SAM protein [Nitrospirota bacterium]
FAQVTASIDKEKPDFVVFTTSTPTIYHDLKIADITKEISPDIKTAAVGTHIMALPEETLRENKNLDFSIYSESEMVLLELVNAGLNPENIKGVAFRKGDEILKNEPRPLWHDLDGFGFPAHQKVPLKLYRDPMMKRGPMTITYTERGCINACIYCSSPFYSKVRQRGIAQVIEELKWIVSMGIREIRFFDCGLTNYIDRAGKLFDEMIKEKIDLTWACNIRSDRFPLHIAKKMKEAGCHTVNIGAESADLEVLKNIKKNITPDMVEQAVLTARKAGLNALVYFMIGLPGETKASIKKTISFAKKIGPELITLGIATPHPGTKFYEHLDRGGYLITRKWSEYDPIKKPVYNYPGLSGKEIEEARDRGYRSFYLRPSYILKRLFAQRRIMDVVNNFRNFVGFMRRYVFKA